MISAGSFRQVFLFNIKLDQRMTVKGMLVLQEHFAELAK